MKSRDISAIGWPISKKFGKEMKTLSVKWMTFTKLMLKIKAVGQSLRLTDPFFITVRYREFSIFKMAVVRHLGFLK